MRTIALNRYSVPNLCVDLALDWCSVVALQKFPLCVNIHLNTGTTLTVDAPTYDANNANYENLYKQWSSLNQYR